MDKIVTLAKQDLTPKVSEIDDLKTLLNSIQSDNWKEEVTKSLTKSVTKSVTKIKDYLAEAKSRQEIFAFLEIGNQTKNFNTNLKPLIENNLIELTMPGKPHSKLQRYRLTVKGRKLIKQ